jgi:hypothetical protein
MTPTPRGGTSGELFSMQREVVLATKPRDLQRFGIISVMHLDLLIVALLTRPAREETGFEVLVGVASTDVLFTLFFGHLSILRPVSPHIGRVT